jgi:nucleoside 2-deoxyribosyltransferase
MSAPAASASSDKPLKIYFCASIRGEVVSKPFLGSLIKHLQQQHGRVLTEHIGFDTCEMEDTTDEAIYARDVAWLRESDVVIAECSSVSIGVGYELGYAEALGKPILILYRWPRADNKRLSAMIAGNRAYKHQSVVQYEDESGAKAAMDRWLVERQAAKPSGLSGRLTHIVGWRLKAEDPAEREKSVGILKGVIEGMAGRIPSLLDIKLQHNAAADIPTNSELCLVAHYNGVKELKEYIVHEVHQEAVKIIVQHVKDRWSIDFFEQ